MKIPDFKTKQQESTTFNLFGKVKVRLLVVIATFAFILISVQLIFAASLATDGHKISDVNDQISKLEFENTLLQAEIAKESSLSSLSKKAGEEEFGKPTKVIVP